MIGDLKDFFCLPLFIKPGKHNYMIKYKDD